MPQAPNYGLQGGSVWAVSDEGTLTIGDGGSIQVASGGVINIASGGSLTGNGVSLTAPVFNTMTLGGTVFRAAYGTVALTAGVGTIATGLTRAFSAGGAIIGRPGLGSLLTVTTDMSLSDTGSVIYYAGTQAGSYTGNATINWFAFGT